MASVKIYFDTRSVKGDGTYPLKLSVTNRGSELINLNISIRKDQWDGYKVIDHPNRKFINSYLLQRQASAESLILKLTVTGELKTISIKELKKRIETEGGEPIEEEPVQIYTVKEHFERFISFKKKKSTQGTYRETIKYVSNFSGPDLQFKDIDITWLKEFNNHLENKELAVNSRAIQMRNIRAVFNDAIKEGKISADLYPFGRKYKIKHEETSKRSLSVENLILLRDYPCEAHQEKYRDLFMLMFYLVGINSIDLFNLADINDGFIHYRREKTGRLYTINIPPVAMEIIEKYKGESQLIDVLDRYGYYKDFTHRMNENLQKIGPFTIGKHGKKIRTPLFPYLTTYYARHTWATIASKLDIPEATIGAALGHGKKNNTNIYIDFDVNKIYEANQKVVDYVNNYGKKKKKTNKKKKGTRES